ncbi:MAG: hypothetical protein ABIQ39_12180 [Ilumatobacteraceae bacterium]
MAEVEDDGATSVVLVLELVLVVVASGGELDELAAEVLVCASVVLAVLVVPATLVVAATLVVVAAVVPGRGAMAEVEAEVEAQAVPAAHRTATVAMPIIRLTAIQQPISCSSGFAASTGG